MGTHAGCPKTPAGFQGPFITIPQALSDPQHKIAADHWYGASENYTQGTDARVNTTDALQALACAATEDKEAMEKLTRIKLILSHSPTQSQEKILVLSKQVQALQTQAKAKTPITEISVLDKKTKETKSKCY